MLGQFLSWWLSQMRALLASLMGPGEAPDALIIAIDQLGGTAPPRGALLLRSRGRLRRLRGLEEPPLGRLPRLPVMLHLPANKLLNRELTLPLAAAGALQTAMRFELDRLTPFSAEELFWGVATESQDRAQGLLRLRLTIVPRALVEAVQVWLAAQQLAPGWIEHDAGLIPLNPGSQRRRMRAVLNGLCAVLAAACLAVPFIRQQIALNQVNALVAERAPAAHVAEKMRARLAASASGNAAIAAARRHGDALQVLAALTKALPDDTWLADLSLKSGSLTMDGQSANAARLIALLAAMPELQNPGFTAPVTRSNDGKADLFSLRAGVAE